MTSTEYSLTDRIFDIIGDDLIAVAEYDADSVEVQYVTGEALDRTTRPSAERIHEELVLEQISAEYLESMFDLGQLSCITLEFEWGVVFNVIRSELDGVFILTNTLRDERVVTLRTEIRDSIAAN